MSGQSNPPQISSRSNQVVNHNGSSTVKKVSSLRARPNTFLVEKRVRM